MMFIATISHLERFLIDIRKLLFIMSLDRCNFNVKSFTKRGGRLKEPEEFLRLKIGRR